MRLCQKAVCRSMAIEWGFKLFPLGLVVMYFVPRTIFCPASFARQLKPKSLVFVVSYEVTSRRACLWHGYCLFYLQPSLNLPLSRKLFGDTNRRHSFEVGYKTLRDINFLIGTTKTDLNSRDYSCHTSLSMAHCTGL